MKSSAKHLLLVSLTTSALFAGALQSQAQTTVTVDSTKNFVGFMNVSSLPADGGTYQFGQGWGTADLRASFTGSNFLTLTPNTNVYNPTDTYWVNADGTGAKTMDASFYVQDDTLAGQTLTFTGTCLTNTLVTPYTCVAFIKDFAPNYSFNIPVTASLVAGQTFSITLSTTPGDHIQYGFETIGPDASPVVLASLGKVVMAVNNADPTLAAIPSESLVEGQTARFTVTATGTAPFSYQWAMGNAAANTGLSDGGRISGSASNTLTISNIVPTDASTYSVLVMNGVGATAVASATLAVVPLTSARTNLLVDASFESAMFSPTPDAGWVNFNGTAEVNTNGFYFGSSTPINVLDGADCIQTYSTGPGSFNGIFQDRPALPGQVYTGSVWLYTPTADRLGGAAQAWVEAQFQNSNGGVVGYYKSAVMDSNTVLDTWIKFSLTNHLGTDFVTPLGTSPVMVAPPGTAKVRFQVNYRADTGGSVFIDLATLSLRAPVPVAAKTNSNIKITYPTVFGPTYQVLFKTNLTDPTWQLLTTTNGDGTIKTTTDAIGTGKRFYTVNTQ